MVNKSRSSQTGLKRKWTGFLVLLSLMVLYAANNAIWAYLDRIGVSRSIDVKTIGIILGVSLAAGVLGAMLAYCIETKVGRAVPIGAGMGAMMIGTLLLLGPFGAKTYLAAASILNGSLSFIVVYYFGFCADLDATGHILCLANFLIIAGLALGPFWGSFFVVGNEYSRLLTMSFFLFLSALIMIEAAIFLSRTRANV